MEESKRYVRLGAFVLVTGCVLVAVLFLLGGRKLFQPTFTFETYFDEPVAGLDLGAPVSFRGVPLGHVTEILTSAATYEADVPLIRRRQYIVVRAEVDFSPEEAGAKRDAAQMVKRDCVRRPNSRHHRSAVSRHRLHRSSEGPCLNSSDPEVHHVPSAPSAAARSSPTRRRSWRVSRKRTYRRWQESEHTRR
jgi:hypothetical protein